MRLCKWLMASVILIQSGSALALFDVQALYGRRWMSAETDGERSGTAYDTMTLGAHVSFMPIVSFGASFSMLDSRDKEEGVKSDKATEIALDVLAEIPLIPIITPYGRIVYPVMGEAVVKGDGYETKAKYGQGFQLHAGVKYSPIPLVGILVEVGKGHTMVTWEELKIDGEKVTLEGHDKDKKAADIDTVMVGVSIGL